MLNDASLNSKNKNFQAEHMEHWQFVAKGPTGIVYLPIGRNLFSADILFQ